MGRSLGARFSGGALLMSSPHHFNAGESYLHAPQTVRRTRIKGVFIGRPHERPHECPHLIFQARNTIFVGRILYMCIGNDYIRAKVFESIDQEQ